MTTATPTRPAVLPAGMTADEFTVWAARPENADRACELDSGGVTDVPPAGRPHGRICSWVGHLFWLYVTARERGDVTTNDTGLVVAEDTVRGPDVMVFADDPPDDEPAGPATETPTLIVEVFSPSDRTVAMLRRVAQYHAMGVPVVWVVYPGDRAVSVHRPGLAPDTFDGPAELTVAGLPGFACRAEDLFRRPPRRPAT